MLVEQIIFVGRFHKRFEITRLEVKVFIGAQGAPSASRWVLKSNNANLTRHICVHTFCDIYELGAAQTL